MSLETLGKQFTETYYRTFESGKENVLQFFAPDALFTYEKHQVTTHECIKQVLDTLSFQTIQHIITNIDPQPTPEGGALLLITGQFKTDDDAPHSFSQVFYLKPIAGSFLITNTIFRISSIHNVV